MRRLLWLLIPCLLAAACSANLAFVPAPTSVAPTTVSTVALPTETPLLPPTPPPTETPACPNAPANRLILNMRGRVLPDDPRPINLRSEPGTNNRSLTSIAIMEIFYVLDGPVCNGDYAWFRIRYGSYEGWIAEGDSSGYYVEPYLAE